MADKQYKVLLLQHDWVNTEVFEITAKDSKAAKAEAEKIVETKDLEGREWKLEIRDGDVAEETAPTSAEPTEPVER